MRQRDLPNENSPRNIPPPDEVGGFFVLLVYDPKQPNEHPKNVTERWPISRRFSYCSNAPAKSLPPQSAAF